VFLLYAGFVELGCTEICDKVFGVNMISSHLLYRSPQNRSPHSYFVLGRNVFLIDGSAEYSVFWEASSRIWWKKIPPPPPHWTGSVITVFTNTREWYLFRVSCLHSSQAMVLDSWARLIQDFVPSFVLIIKFHKTLLCGDRTAPQRQAENMVKTHSVRPNSQSYFGPEAESSFAPLVQLNRS
jgi:hypothetical protein